MGQGKRRSCKDVGERKDSQTGMAVGGKRRQSICQLLLHRLQIVIPYHFISVPSAVTEMEVQRNKLSRLKTVKKCTEQMIIAVMVHLMIG